MLDKYLFNHKADPLLQIGNIQDKSEKRLLYFATQEGFESFFKRLVFSLKNNIKATQPKCILDLEVEGPWSNYTTVWRYLFAANSKLYLCDSADYFLF
ncbi:MAG: hypothetical protein HY843_00950 [Bdellovibrio sp.]|nr:hypothetical protein [Bdellovibrio sp.]